MKTKMLRYAAGCAVAAVIGAAPGVSMAGLGDSLYAAGGTITATFEGSDAGYDSLLGLVVTSPSYTSPLIFPNHSTAAGTTYTFGSFAAGTPLDFQLHVVTTGDIWHTGPASNNSDGIIHANVIFNWTSPGRTFVGFEDLRGGGDGDYNDHMFSFTNVAPTVPEPETYAMLLAGLGLLGFMARRRNQQSA